jgi:anaerobic dimethyl sulfoxide reductase subunit B
MVVAVNLLFSYSPPTFFPKLACCVMNMSFDVSRCSGCMACMHCGDAPCIAVCPNRALSKSPENGVVEVNKDLWIGCHTCATACPFGAPQFPEGSFMRKCDFCVARVTQGLEPACVRTCPTKALGFGPIGKLTKEKAKAASTKIVLSFNPNLAALGLRLNRL